MLTLQDQNLLLARYARGRESTFVDRYIAEGPMALRESLGLNEEQWRVVFDYLVFEHNLLYKTVTRSSEFFVENYIRHGMAHVLEILDITDEKYNLIIEVVFDFLAISSEGLYYHVLQHRDRYMVAFKVRGGDFVRKVLGIWKNKYEEHWAKILDLFLHSVCDDFFAESHFDNGILFFSSLMNTMRIHRPVEKSEMFRKSGV